MAGELLPFLLAELTKRGLGKALEIKVSDEHEGVVIEAHQLGRSWLVGADGNVICQDCGWYDDPDGHCDC